MSTSNGANPQRVTMPSSRPLDDNTWQVIGVVSANLTGGQTMRVQAFAICTT